MNFDQTLKDQREFKVFSLALTTLSNSTRLLHMGGANAEAISHLNRAIELISRQLNEAAERIETDEQADRDVKNLLKTLGVTRAGEDSANSNPAKP